MAARSSSRRWALRREELLGERVVDLGDASRPSARGAFAASTYSAGTASTRMFSPLSPSKKYALP
jgi:hypothetical protein